MYRTRHELASGWSFKQLDQNSEDWLPVQQVPTQVHLDLLANRKIEDPFVDLNELSAQWIAEKDWVYRTQFNAPNAPRKGIKTTLVFEGLDTFATVTLNGVQILESENMHLSHRIDVSDIIQPGDDNVLELVFRSALHRGREIVQQHPEHQHFARQTEEGRIPVRKAQYNWGWDWGPILMTAGPWRPVYLEQYSCRINEISMEYELSSDLSACSGKVYAQVDSASPGTDSVVLELSLDGNTVFREECSVNSDGLVEANFRIENPSLWHPAGYGAQSRYKLSVELSRGDVKSDSMSKYFGFRRAELVQEKDLFGKSFYFRINGIDIFSGGSCWIPADSFLSQISSQRYLDWMKLLVEGNQIMIRVWGGGVYEDDAFFDACDELGILVWHDFAFVCGNYPVYPAFLKSVEQEARQNIQRLRSHPSIVIWAGNNEDYQVQERYKLEYNLHDKDPESWLKTTFPARYIYEYFLPKILAEEDPSAIYHPGSPWGDGKHTTDPTVGDIHQWNIWHGQMSRYQDSDQLSGRFVSEFGMEAYPHLQTTRRMITDPSQQYPGSISMDFRNKAGDHERRLNTYLCENFRVKYDLPAFTHLTQVLQAETMKYAYKSWRRMWGKAGSRKCGGVLVWQLNDCWPTMSWAIVDYYLVKKPSYYAISRALRPLDVGISRSCPEWTSGHADPTLLHDTKFDVWVASSKLQEVEVNLVIQFVSIRSGREVFPQISTRVSAQPNGTTEVLKDQHLKYHRPVEDESNATISVRRHDPFVIHATLSVGNTVVATDTAWPQPLKYLDLSDRKISIERSSSGDEVTVSAELPVKAFVFEEREGLSLSDNGFDIVPGEKHVVKITGHAVTAEELRWTYVGASDRLPRSQDSKL
ncbi:Beta-mannosidase B 1 [Colletotrichum truncatum]|uniref:Beta-mannosidase B 1 n=1 Tax=Colletotrichum truncatum TaxID=5467 RepID=A0ACC3ZKK9_COLTU|nr:Beta-mannosidase B 1 [Colletotrichum truncatum]KAF6800003.1 Beta-mannosidase B 1 [Colletotrichum truncatum]